MQQSSYQSLLALIHLCLHAFQTQPDKDIYGFTWACSDSLGHGCGKESTLLDNTEIQIQTYSSRALNFFIALLANPDGSLRSGPVAYPVTLHSPLALGDAIPHVLHVRHDVRTQRSDNFTLSYFLISHTRLLNTSSTLIRCFAEVSINRQPSCLARSRPSNMQSEKFPGGENVSPYRWCQLDVRVRDHSCFLR